MELFRYPALLAWLAAAFAALVFFRFKAEERRVAASKSVLGPSYERFASGPEAARRRLRGLLFFAALALIAVSAAGPQWGVQLSPVTDLKGNIVIAVDASLSMAARDLKPDRLSNAKLLLTAVTDRFADYRIGVVAFAGAAYTQCPLTTDRDAITYFTSALRPGMLPSQGTDFSEAIDTTLRMLSRYGGEKVMVLVTDGEDHSQNLDDMLKAAKDENLKIFTIGIGSPDGELVPMTDSGGNTMEYKKDRAGKTVVSRLGESTLMKIASRTGAAYLRYSDPDSAAASVRSGVEAMDLERSKGKGRASYKNRYQWPLALALVLLLIELLIMEKGFLFSFRRPRIFGRKGAGGAAMLFLLLGWASPGPADAGEFSKGDSAYRDEDWQGAIEHYSRALSKTPKDKRLEFNIGDAYYRQEEYDKAAEAFERAGADGKIAARAYYNRGNTFFRKGDLSGAIAEYRRALELDPEDENAKFNLQKALEQKKKNNSCDKPEEKKDKKDDKKQEQKKDGGQDKKKQEKEKQQKREQEKKKAEARERSKQILEMMKEKEKAAARDTESMRQALKRQDKVAPERRLEDW